MKCSVIAQARWSKSKKVLTVGSANVFLDINEIEDGTVVVPVQLKYIRQKNGKLGEPFVDVRQPQYKNESGKWVTSYLSVHLNGKAAKAIEGLVSADFLKPAITRIQGSKVAADYERENGSWKHVGDRELTQSESHPEDEDFLRNAVAMADQLAQKAAAQTAAGTGMVISEAADLDKILGGE